MSARATAPASAMNRFAVASPFASQVQALVT